jgi:hypothetical protein
LPKEVSVSEHATVVSSLNYCLQLIGRQVFEGERLSQAMGQIKGSHWAVFLKKWRLEIESNLNP